MPLAGPLRNIIRGHAKRGEFGKKYLDEFT